jgi:Mn2+/Fe2+ NRAMP family transporter
MDVVSLGIMVLKKLRFDYGFRLSDQNFNFLIVIVIACFICVVA